MTAVCNVRGKGPGFDKSVSHSYVRANRRWNSDTQRIRALVNGTPGHPNVCIKYLKSDKVARTV